MTPAVRRILSPAAAITSITALVLSSLMLGAIPASAAEAPVSVTALKANNLSEPLGIDGDAPGLSWQLASDARGVVQSAYQVRVATSDAALSGGTVWDSGRVESDDSVHVQYGGPALVSQTRYSWQVRVWDGDGAESAWSTPSSFETGILDADEWEADWIGGPDAAEDLTAWSDYTATVEYTLTPGTAFGVFVRASALGNDLMWQLNDEIPGQPRLRPHFRVNGGGYSAAADVNLVAKGLSADVLTRRGTVVVSVAGSTIETRINGVLVDTRTDTNHPTGYIGFRTNQSTTANESVVIHSARVVSPTATLLDTDFSDGNPFGGGTVGADGLTVSGNSEILVTRSSNHPLLRTDFAVAKTVKSARVYAAARGIYELSLNGQKVGDRELAPGWTDYTSRIDYQTYDVTDLLVPGDNAFGGMTAPGWYSGRLAHIGDNNYGNRESLIAQLRIDFTDGTSETVATDDSWTTATGPFVEADLIQGETYNAANERTGWNSAGYDTDGWSPVAVLPSATALLEPQSDPPVRETGLRPALTHTQPENGSHVYDVGQNMVGVARVTLAGLEGETVRIRYAEELNPDGTMYVANLRSAKATDYYTFAADGEITYEPTFTSHGFRYIELSGVSTVPGVDKVAGVVWGSDLGFTGTLDTSNAMLNQLQSNITWGQRGNFLSIPTDTPARDERMGWSGDINVFAPTASYNMDSLNFLSKWLVDLQDAQQPNGDYWGVAPYQPNLACCTGGTGWSDAGITVPWVLWQSYGDTSQVRDGWASMTEYMDYLETSYPTMVRGSSYADWLNLDDPTPGEVLGTAYYAYVSRLMSEMATAIDKPAEAAHYLELAERGETVFADTFVADDGTVTGDSQAGYAIALGMKLVPDAQRAAVADQFLETLERRDFHLSTGFLGTPWLVPALSESGHLDDAYRLLLTDTFPSWGYEVAQGATTMWERWDSIMPDGSFGDVSMNSFNHYAYGAVGDWMYKNIGGIAIGSPGYQHSIVAPRPGGGLTRASGSYDSVYGTISTDWEATTDAFALDVTVPANATATVVLPAASVVSVTESGAPLDDADGVTDSTDDGETVSVEIGSGSYSFVVSADAATLGAIVDETAAAAALVSELHDADELASEQRDSLLAALAEVTDDATAAVAALRSADTAEVLERLAAIVATLDGADERIDEWIADASLGDDTATALGARVQAVRVATGLAVARLGGFSTELRVIDPLVTPGGAAALELAVANGSGGAITGLATGVVTGGGWTVTAATPEDIGDVPAGETRSRAFVATAPADAVAEDAGAFTATARFTAAGNDLLTTATATVVVSAPIVLGAPVVSPAPAAPDQAVTVTVPVTNRAAVPVTVQLAAGLPTGWGGEARSEPQTVAAGATVDIAVPVVVPLSVTDLDYSVPISAYRGSTLLATASATIAVDLAAVQYDAIDLGVTASEQAHNLTAAPQSGTSSEAGLTRRYSHSNFPDSYFQFDLTVPAGEPFTLRTVETYGSAGTKEYTVTANGVLVHSRLNTVAAAGTAEYEFDVSDPAISASGTVSIRYQKGATPAFGDPSIANVWAYSTAVTDHIDLGFGYSETTHALTAAASSATAPDEAGLTRRYSGVNTPGSWFEFDARTVAGEPFLLRVLETYDKPQQKEYTVLVNGTAVEARAIPRTEGGAGTRAYQVYVDDPALIAGDSVRVRMQKSDTGAEKHDPSVADVWLLSVPADTQAPVVSAAVAESVAGANGWSRGPVTVALGAQDSRDSSAEIEYRVDGGAWTAYTAPVTISADGEHSLEYRATDAAGNVSDPAATTVRIDATAPTAVVALPDAGPSGWLGAGATATLTGADATSGVAGVEYRLGGGEWTAYGEPFPLPDGEYELEYRATDTAGNTGAAVSTAVRSDGTVPTLTADAPADGSWITDDTRITLAASDGGQLTRAVAAVGSGVASIEYRLAGGAWTAYTAPIAVADGVTTIEYRATDVAGNTATAAAPLVVRADRVAPVAAFTLSADRELAFTGTDATSGIAAFEYALGDGDFARTVAPVVVSTASQSLRFRAVDLAGNVSAARAAVLPGAVLSAESARAGDTVTVSGAGFEPGESIDIRLSGTAAAASVVASSTGTFETSLTVPAGTPVGARPIVVEAQSGVVVTLAFAVRTLPTTPAQVVDDVRLSLTGSESLPILLLGGALAAAGALLLVRRRRHTEI